MIAETANTQTHELIIRKDNYIHFIETLNKIGAVKPEILGLKYYVEQNTEKCIRDNKLYVIKTTDELNSLICAIHSLTAMYVSKKYTYEVRLEQHAQLYMMHNFEYRDRIKRQINLLEDNSRLRKALSIFLETLFDEPAKYQKNIEILGKYCIPIVTSD